jgi:hypothetical protein
MGAAALGLHRVLIGTSALSAYALGFFLLGLVAGTLHFGPDAVNIALLPPRFVAAGESAREYYLAIGQVLVDLSLFFEKVWGLARGAAMLLFSFALMRYTPRGRAILIWSFIGGAEFFVRIHMIAVNAPMNFLLDLLFVSWLVAVGIWLAGMRPRI